MAVNCVTRWPALANTRQVVQKAGSRYSKDGNLFQQVVERAKPRTAYTSSRAVSTLLIHHDDGAESLVPSGCCMDARRLSQLGRKHLFTVTLSLTGLVFAICLLTSIGWALGGLYLLPVVLAALWSSSRQYFGMVVSATLASIALTLSFFLSPHWANKLVAVTCYVIPLLTILFVGFLSMVRKWVQHTAQLSRTFAVCASCRKVKGQYGWSLDPYLQQPPGTLLRLDLCPGCASKFGVDFDSRRISGQADSHNPALPNTTVPATGTDQG